jgi:hypothetical protein
MANQNISYMGVKFYGLNDHGTYSFAGQAVRVLEQYDPSSTPNSVNDVLELYNAQLFAEHDVFPSTYTDKERNAIKSLIPELRKTAGRFFSTLRDENIADVVIDVSYQYHADLLKLFAQHKVYDRCTAATVLHILEQNNMGIGVILANLRLVQAYDQEMRTRLVSDPRNAEQLISKYLDRDARHPVYLPASFTETDARALLDSYLDSDDANPNFVRLVATAKPMKEAGIDAKLKLKAKRKDEAWTEEFFKNNTGMKSGSVVGISDTQVEPVTVSRDQLVAEFSYSRRWLEDGLDFPTILNNFLYLFEFANYHMLLTLPSYPANLGVFERFMGVTGKNNYRSGIVFRLKDQSSFLQTVLYSQFLQTKNIELESVISWFFAEYLKAEFGADNFRFIPSSTTSSYLERSRHLFSEMESVVKQFSLYASDGELDTDLLTITSDPVVYKTIPSLVAGKYVYADKSEDIRNILYLLFSDQSGLTYISDNLRGADGAQLLLDNQVSYEDFHHYQKPIVDYLIGLSVLENTGAHVRIADIPQFRILQSIFHTEAISYYHYSAASRARIDDMVGKGWLVRDQSLLTHSEGSYFNYNLNQSEFSDGPDLRNKYLHGSQAGGDNEDQHYSTYITALKLLVALVIKMNDEFWLRDEERKRAAGSAACSA